MGKIILPVLEKDKICSFVLEPGEKSIVTQPEKCYYLGQIYGGKARSKYIDSVVGESGFEAMIRCYLEECGSLDSYSVALYEGAEKRAFQLPVTKENCDLVNLYARMLFMTRSDYSYANGTMHVDLKDIGFIPDVVNKYITLAQDLQHISEEKRVSRLNDIGEYRRVLNIAKFLKSLKEVNLIENSVESIKKATLGLPVDLSSIDKYIELAKGNNVNLQTLRTVLELTYLDQEDRFTSKGYYKRHKGN